MNPRKSRDTPQENKGEWTATARKKSTTPYDKMEENAVAPVARTHAHQRREETTQGRQQQQQQQQRQAGRKEREEGGRKMVS